MEETEALGDGWTFGGYAVLPGTASVEACRDASFGGAQAVEVPVNVTEDTTICVLNVFEEVHIVDPETPTPTPTPTETPKTPAPPKAGTGFDSGPGAPGMSVLLTVLGLIAISLGAASIAAARRTNTNSR